jgi:DNA modification methylase
LGSQAPGNRTQGLADLGFDTDITGFFLEDFIEEDAPRDETEPDLSELDEENTVTKTGDIWLMGNHRLMCGDSTRATDFAKLMAGAQADLVITDPPYNVNYGDKAEMLEDYMEGKGHRITSEILNDNMSDEEFLHFLTDAFTHTKNSMVDGAPIYVFHAETEGFNFRAAFRAAGLKLSQCLIWVKNSFVLGRQDYHWRHEPVLYGWKEGEAHSWYGGRKKDTALLEEFSGITVKKTKDGDLLTFTNGIEQVAIRARDYDIEDTNTIIYHENHSVATNTRP